MRYLCLALAGISTLLAQTDADLFDDSVVQEFRLTVKQADWDYLRANYLLNDYVPADLRWLYKGQYISYPKIGIRSRGYGSRNPNKMNLRLDVNHYDDNETIVTLNSVDLKANNQDISMLKERTVFHLWDRMGLPVSRDVHARVYVNEQYYGTFLTTEEISKKYLKRTLGENDGDLFSWNPLDQLFYFEWNPVCTATKVVACSTDPAKWTPLPFGVETNSSTYDISQQINLIRTINTAADADFESAVNPLTNLKLWIYHNALEVYVADFDSIMGDVFGANNFYLYRWEKSTLQQFLVWDKDGSYDWSHRSIFQNTDQNVFMRRTLAIPARKTQYLDALYKIAVLAGGAGGWMENENHRLYAQIQQAAYADPNKLHNDGGLVSHPVTNDEFDAAVAYNTTFIQERRPWVLDEIANAGYQPPTSIRIASGGVLNAASNAAGAIAPGSLVTIYGTGLAASTATVTTAPLPTKVAGVSVFVNGYYAPLLYVSPTQINFQVPWELGLGDGTAPFTVSIDGTATKGTTRLGPLDATFGNSISATVKTYGPGLFLARRADGTLVSDAAPATAGDVIVVYATGLGPVSVAQTTGALAAAALVTTTQTPVVTIGGVRADVQFSGLTPGTAGVYQINVRVPAGIPTGSASLVATIGNEASAPLRLATR